VTGPGLCVVVGGAGAVGRMVVDLLVQAGGEVAVVDRAATGSPTEVVRGDVTRPEPALRDLLGRADVVVLAVPEPVALAALPAVLDALRPGALLLDTLSVKGPYVAAVGQAAVGLEVLGLNPMFAPSLGIAGRPVAAVVVHDGPRARRVRELVVAAGAHVVELSADGHDRLAAATQALTHATVLAFGLALAELDVGIDALVGVAPPPHLTMVALLARITSGAPAVYWDVQAANRHAPAARRALAEGARRLADIVESGAAHGSSDAFADVLDRLRDLLGPHRSRLAELCARTFATLANP
jgi:prephenate dehydrogenase